MHLYTLDESIVAIQERIEAHAAEHEGEIPDDLDAMLEGLLIDRERKLLDLGRWVKGLDAEGAAITAEARKLMARAARTDALAERVKAAIARSMLQGEKLSDVNTALSWRKSQAVEITDEAAIPDAYYKVVRAVSKADIKADLKAGREVAGAVLVERQNLQIK
jgi:hypothetical protein